MPTSLGTLAGLLVLVALGNGCAPSCEAVCRKIDRCDVADGFGQLECEESCNRQAAQYELEDEDALTKAFADHRRCMGGATCDAIDAGECYDEDLFLF